MEDFTLLPFIFLFYVVIQAQGLKEVTPFHLNILNFKPWVFESCRMKRIDVVLKPCCGDRERDNNPQQRNNAALCQYLQFGF